MEEKGIMTNLKKLQQMVKDAENKEITWYKKEYWVLHICQN